MTALTESAAPPRVAVELRQDDAVESDALLERDRDVHGFLARHGVEHEEDVQRLQSVTNGFELIHQLLVDVKPAGRVHDDDVEPVGACLVEPVPGRCHRVLRVQP